MVIGIDGNEANVENRVGVNQYAFELLHALYKLPESMKHKFYIYLKEKPSSELPKEKENWKYVVLPGGGKWIIKKLMPRLYTKKEKLDVFFTPSHYVPPFAPVPRVCAVMDLGYLESAGQFRKYDFWQLKLWTAWSMRASRKIIAISEATKAHMAETYPYTKNKTKVTLLAGDTSVKNAKVSKAQIGVVKRKYKINGEYVLFLGTLKPSKNIDGIIAAWAGIHTKYPEMKLVIAGKKGWLFESIFQKTKEHKISKKVVFTGFISDREKQVLLSGAKLFAMPSFWEGFGIDILNAFSCGVPVVTSKRGSIPEVGGDAALYADPNNVDDISEKIDKVLSMSKNDYNNLSKKVKKQAGKFSWEKTARETLKILDSVSSTE
jgi:glycosyltransferase involved in cell wall biosynthesis